VLGRVPPEYRITDYDPSTRRVIVSRRNRVVGAMQGGRVRPLLEINRDLERVPVPARMLVDYRGADGDSLHAVAILPPGYRKGERYPVVLWVYAGDQYTSAGDVGMDPTVSNAFNLFPLLSAGYVLLYPSIPLPHMGAGATDMREAISNGVLPAADRLTELGIADPHRVAVMGQSFGGYTVLSLITSTSRFRTAIALAGPADHVLDYGSLRPWDRYRPDAYLAMANQKMAEAGQGRLGAPPSLDLWRYLKNSPVYYLDRVTTPLLLIHGDQDHVPIEGAEEVFTGLHRLGKRVRFVRYFGEGHVIDSPANIRDMWARIFAWLAETMPPN
jgi:dipeptidyl aminopeptidase/acylaminoacyl peptidase